MAQIHENPLIARIEEELQLPESRMDELDAVLREALDELKRPVRVVVNLTGGVFQAALADRPAEVIGLDFDEETLESWTGPKVLEYGPNPKDWAAVAAFGVQEDAGAVEHFYSGLARCLRTEAPAPQLDDAQALESIQSLLSGKAWSPETLDDIRDILLLAGREVKDVDDGGASE